MFAKPSLNQLLNKKFLFTQGSLVMTMLEEFKKSSYLIRLMLRLKTPLNPRMCLPT